MGSTPKGNSNAGTISLGNYNLDQLLSNLQGNQQAVDQSKILGLNAADTAERKATLEAQNTARQGQLSDLATLLAKQNQTQLGQAAPSILEDLNARGLARSSAVGNQYANALSNLTANTNNQIAQQSLANTGLYTAGQSGITEADIAGKGTALQRGLSLQDYANQLQAGRALGQINQPANQPVQSGKGGASGAITGGLTGASTGAAFTKNPYVIGGLGAVGALGGSGILQ